MTLTDPNIVAIDLSSMLAWADAYLDGGEPIGLPAPELCTVAATVLVWAHRALVADPLIGIESSVLSTGWAADLLNVGLAVVDRERRLQPAGKWVSSAFMGVMFVCSETLKHEPVRRQAELLAIIRTIGVNR